MSRQKKQKNIITSRQFLERLYRLQVVKTLPIPKLVAYIGLNLVNKGNPVPVAKALKIIGISKLDKKLIAGKIIPLENVLESVIFIVLLKRELLKSFFDNKDLPIWSDENIAPILDIMQELSEIYKI